MWIFTRRGEEAIELGAETVLLDPAEGLTEGEWLTEPPRREDPADPPQATGAARESGDGDRPADELASAEDPDSAVELHSDPFELEGPSERDEVTAEEWASTGHPLRPYFATAAVCALIALVVLTQAGGGGGTGSGEEQPGQARAIEPPTPRPEPQPPAGPRRKAQAVGKRQAHESRRLGAHTGRPAEEAPPKEPGPWSPAAPVVGATEPPPAAPATAPAAPAPPAPASEAPVDTAYQSEFGP